jgi:hypothetical protein
VIDVQEFDKVVGDYLSERKKCGQEVLLSMDAKVLQVSKGHRRLEVRTLTVSHELKDYLGWPFLEQVFKLERTVTRLKSGETKNKVIYGFTSLSPDQVTAKQLFQLIRSYWGIENGLHYRRDVTLQEDATRMTNTNLAHVMATINNLVIGLFCQQSQFVSPLCL